MRTLTKLVAVLLLAVGSGAVADPTTPPPPPAPAAPTATPPAGDPATAAAPPPKEAPMISIGEMTKETGQLHAQVDGDVKRIAYLREQARKQKDVIKLNCVNDKIVELKAQQNIFDETNDHLQDAMLKDSAERGPLFSQLTSVAQQIKVLREGASACIGEPELYKQESGGHADHPDIPDDPTKDHPFGNTEIEPPGYCSPFN